MLFESFIHHNFVFAGQFSDTFNFNIGSLSTVTATALNISFDVAANSLGNISFFAASLDGAPLALSTTTTPILPGFAVVTQKLLLSDVPRLAGSHTLTIGGVGDSFINGYIGSIAVTAVPEPETYALMLAGLGAIGLLMKRRST